MGRFVVVLLAVLVCAGGGYAGQSEQEGGRVTPHLFMSPSGLHAARADAIDPVQAALREALLKRAQEALGELPRYVDPADPSRPAALLRPWPTEREGEIGELLKIRWDARDVQVLAVAYAITGEARYADKAWANLHAMLAVYEAFGSFHPVRKNNDLAAAEAYRAIAMAWDLCRDRLPAPTRDLILTEGVRRARDMYATAVRDWRLNDLPVPFATPGVAPEKGPDNRNLFAMLFTNHGWVNIASLGLMGLALRGEDCRAAGPGSGPEDWARFAEHFFGYLAEILPADGSYPESRVYGAPYAAEGAMPFLMALRRTGETDLLARTTFFRNLAYARMYAVWDHAHHRGVANFGEGGDGEWQSPAWIYACASAYRDPVLQWSANQWTRAGVSTDDYALQYLAYDPTVGEAKPGEAGLPNTLFLGDVSEVDIRGGATPWGAESTVFSFRGSETGRAQYRLRAEGKLPYVTSWHSHESRNAALLAVNGQVLLGRATDGEPNTRLYSALEVNGQDQHEPEAALEGIRDFEATDEYVTFSSEVGPAYGGLENYRRRVVYLPPGLYLLIDEAAAGTPVAMDYRLHFGRPTHVTAVAPGASAARLEGELGEGEHAVPFTCEVLGPGPLTAELGAPPGRRAGRTLRYGPPESARESRVVAALRVGTPEAKAGWGTAVRSAQPGLLGVSFPEAVIVSTAAGASGASYSVSQAGAAMRHLVVGVAPGDYQVATRMEAGRVTVTIAPGKGVESSAQGTLYFEVNGQGQVHPLRARPQPNALQP